MTNDESEISAAEKHRRIATDPETRSKAMTSQNNYGHVAYPDGGEREDAPEDDAEDDGNAYPQCGLPSCHFEDDSE